MEIEIIEKKRPVEEKQAPPIVNGNVYQNDSGYVYIVARKACSNDLVVVHFGADGKVVVFPHTDWICPGTIMYENARLVIEKEVD